MRSKSKNAIFGRYPVCDMLNNALRDLFSGNTDSAINEIVYAIIKADGYIHDDVLKKLEEKRPWVD